MVNRSHTYKAHHPPELLTISEQINLREAMYDRNAHVYTDEGREPFFMKV